MSERRIHLLLHGVLIGLLLITGLARAQAPVTPTPPVGGTTLVDPLQLQNGDIRTLPRIPRVGAWGILLGRPETSAQGRGVLIEKPGQVIVYPTTELLSGPTGTIEFSVLVSAATAADTPARTLLDSWSVSGPARFLLTLQGNKLQLALTNEKNQTSTVEGAVNWGAASLQKISLLWSEEDVALQVNGHVIGKAEKPVLPSKEPLAIALGNNRDFQSPAQMAFSDLRLSTAREAVTPANLQRLEDATPNIELTLKMAQGYQRRLYPLLERLRQQKVLEVDFAYAVAYADIGDMDRALQIVTPIARNVQHALYVQAVFLRADLLSDGRDYGAAYEQLQVLTASRDLATVVRAQVKQAEVLYEQGNKPEAMRLIGEIIARYTDLREINDAYLIIGMDQFRSGNFQGAFRAFDSIGIPGAPPRQSTAIDLPLQVKVADADLNVRLSDVGLPITVSATSGDKEQVVLKPAFSRGVYIGSVETVLGDPKPGDEVLQVQGNDKLRITYTDRLSGDGGNVERTIGIDLATDAKLSILAQAALNVYREVTALQKNNIMDDHWEVIGTLPDTVSDYFRDPETGLARPRGTRFDKSFLYNIKPGQSAYIELYEPDADITVKPDNMEVDLATSGGKKLRVNLTETGAHTGIFAVTLKTTPTGTPREGMLEVGVSDSITVRYTDTNPAAGTSDPLRIARMVIQPAEGAIACGIIVPDVHHKDQKVLLQIYRVSNNTSLVAKVEDRDLDITDTPDKVTVKLNTPGGAGMPLTLTETGPHTGIFTGNVKIVTDPASTDPAACKVKPGDVITAVYTDEENRSGKPINREFVFRANIPENATMVFARKIIDQPKTVKGKPAPVEPAINAGPPKVTWEETTALVPGYVYRVRLTDGDILPTGTQGLTSSVLVKSTNGSSAEVPLHGNMDAKTMTTIFEGLFFVRLGDKNSPSRAYVSETGAVVEIKDDEEAMRRGSNAWATPTINVQGKDNASVNYIEPLGANNQANIPRKADLRVAADAEISLLNMQGNPLEILKPGMPFELQIEDPNGDLTPKRDVIKAVMTSSSGDTLPVDLTETDLHSGVFSAFIETSPGAVNAKNTVLEVPFDGKLTVTYRDEQTIVGAPADRIAELTARPLTDADCVMLTKLYDDPKFQVETLVRLGESFYAVGAAELATTKIPAGQPRTNAKLQTARRLMQQVIDQFPTSEFVIESLFLTGKILREEQKYDDAQKLFTRVIEEYPDSEFVPQVLFQLTALYLDQEDIENGTETAMRLIYGFPKNPLVADAFLRIAEYYYNIKKEYRRSAGIYQRVVDRFPDNPKIDLIFYRMATAFYRAGLADVEDKSAFTEAAKQYLIFADTYKDSELVDDALYWAANALKKSGSVVGAYRVLTRLVVTMPAEADMRGYATRMRNEIKEQYPTIDEMQ
ncbi:MAG: tetratricopeptide repeat protein [Armatimonadota bacterium]